MYVLFLFVMSLVDCACVCVFVWFVCVLVWFGVLCLVCLLCLCVVVLLVVFGECVVFVGCVLCDVLVV